jgi:hypothetical protein
MKKKALFALLLLALICTFIAGYGQMRRAPVTITKNRIRLNQYGVLLSMPGPKGEGVTQLQYEGYRLTMRVKDPKTGKKERVVIYAVGAQQTSANLKPVRLNEAGTESLVQTTDKSMDLRTRVVEKNGVVEIVRRLLANKEFEVERVEILVEQPRMACLLGGLVFGKGICTECQGCGCTGPKCTGGNDWARGTPSSRPFEHPLPNEEPTSSSPTQDIAVLTWTEGVNFKPITLTRGQSIVLREILTFNPEDAGTRHP